MGVVCIGPGPESMLARGVKINARKIARDAGVPCMAGSDDEMSNLHDTVAVAEKIGYPVLLKASAVGGGKGMTIIHRKCDLLEAFARARSEAPDAFGNGVRVGGGYRQGMEVSVHYTLISKPMVYGRDREEAIARLIRADDGYRIAGVKNTLLFGSKVLRRSKFIDDFDTSFVSPYLGDEENARVLDDDRFRKAGVICAAALYAGHEVVQKQITPAHQNSQRKNRSWDGSREALRTD